MGEVLSKTIASLPNASDIPILELDLVVKTLAGKDEMNIDQLLCEDRSNEKPFDTYFVCMICASVVKPTPKKCEKCDSLFCNDCLSLWKKRGSEKCPGGCGQNPMVGVDLTRLERRTINKLAFNCPECKEDVYYE